jgi:hypothetical protein
MFQQQAAIYNQIAFIYNRSQNSEKEIEYSSLTIALTPYLTDIEVVKRAHLRRGLAYA